MAQHSARFAQRLKLVPRHQFRSLTLVAIARTSGTLRIFRHVGLTLLRGAQFALTAWCTECTLRLARFNRIMHEVRCTSCTDGGFFLSRRVHSVHRLALPGYLRECRDDPDLNGAAARCSATARRLPPTNLSDVHVRFNEQQWVRLGFSKQDLLKAGRYRELLPTAQGTGQDSQ